MSLLVRLTLGFSLLSPAMVLANNIDYAQCGVPVCDIQETMTSLRAMTGDKRGMYALNLKNTHKDATDLVVLENLRAAGLEIKKLFAELNDEAWVRNAASDLVNTAIFNLAKFSEIDGERLGRLYTELNNQTFRYNMLSHWQGVLSKQEDSKAIEQLIMFADTARAHSVKVGDEDWVPRAASVFISEATVKLTNLDPAHEGLYNVDVHSSLKYIDALNFDRVAVLDSSSSKNLVIALINTRLRVIVHSFSQAEIMGNTVTGLSLSTGEIATKFTMTLNRQTGEVVGTLESTTNGASTFSGNQLVSSRSVFAGELPVPLTDKDVLGTMSGVLGGVKGKLTVSSFKENVYSATFASDTGSIFLNFQGKFFPKKGVLGLTSGEKLKLTISLRNKSWSGFSFSTTTGTHSKATFSTIE